MVEGKGDVKVKGRMSEDLRQGNWKGGKGRGREAEVNL